MKSTYDISKSVGTFYIISICLLIIYFFITPVYAFDRDYIDSGEADVVISGETHYSENYRYACDIIFYNMKFKYKLKSIAMNSETDETYINSGDWAIDDYELNEIPITIVNHADTPLVATAKIDDTDFRNCNITVDEKLGFEKIVLDACKIDKEGIIISESSAQYVLRGYPELSNYKGEKTLGVLVTIKPSSGYTTNGKYFEYES